MTIEGTNLSGKAVKVTTSAIGIVSAVDFSSGQPMVTVGAAKVPLSDVSEVRIPETPSTGGNA
jgi:flagellar basal-body rod modification protein FlgD